MTDENIAVPSNQSCCTGGLGCCNPHGDCPQCGCAGKIEQLTRERDEWATKWHKVRAELAELKYPGMKGVVRALDSSPAAAANPQCDAIGGCPELRKAREALLTERGKIERADADNERLREALLVCAGVGLPPHRNRIVEMMRTRARQALAGSPGETSAGRTPQDYAIEHAGYLADAVGQFLEVLNECDCAGIALSELDEDDEEYDDASQDVDVAWEKRQDHLQAVQNAVYEFRKRAERAKGSAVKASEATPTCKNCGWYLIGEIYERSGTCEKCGSKNGNGEHA